MVPPSVPKLPQAPGREGARARGEWKQREPKVNDASHESVAPRTRRRFTASQKLRLVRAADVALASGKRGALKALLRKEAIYSSQLAAWRQQLGTSGEAGLASRKPGRKPRLGAAGRELLAATKQNKTLHRKLRIANALIDSPKKGARTAGADAPRATGGLMRLVEQRDPEVPVYATTEQPPPSSYHRAAITEQPPPSSHHRAATTDGATT
jgi:transposase